MKPNFKRENYDKRVKVYSSISILIGAILLILGTMMLFVNSEE